jgi:glycosyltransferase involved in cell wall biosynthesis
VIDETDFDAYLFQDADDWSAPDRLERLIDAATSTGAGLVGSDYALIACDRASVRHEAFPLDVNAALAASPTCHALQHPTSLVARSLVARLGGYSSGMRFSGDDEFLRRAAHATTVVNVPRVLYYRRLRADSLTTARTTGHGSERRRSVLRSLAMRAEANAAAVAAGRAPRLEPFISSAPVGLVHCTGPALHAPAARIGAGGAPPGRRRQGKSVSAPAVIVGTAGTEILACGLGHHSRVVVFPAGDWLAPMVEALSSAGPGAVKVPAGAQREPGPLDAIGTNRITLITAAGALLTSVATGAIPPPGQSAGGLESALWEAARPKALSGTQSVISVPCDVRAVEAVFAAWPHAKLVHVVQHVEDSATLESARVADVAGRPKTVWRRWLDDVHACLEAERLAGDEPSRVLRIDYRELVTRPEPVLRQCLDFMGLDDDRRCAWPLMELDVPFSSSSADSTLEEDVDDPDRLVAEDLATALCGPRRRRRQASRSPAAQGAAVPAAPDASRRPSDSITVSPRSFLRAVAPTGSIVAVTSRGDDRLLDLGEATGWHFPQMADGTWAGHYPADSAEAVAHLEALRLRGARYLFVPEWASWWLEYYDGLRAHLEQNGRVAAHQEDAGTLFELSGDETPTAGELDGLAAATELLSADREASANASFGSRTRRKVTVIAWSVAHNPLGRAHLLAEMLSDKFDVEIVGNMFERFGREIWEPHRGSRIPIRAFDGCDFPDYLDRLRRIAGEVRGDALLVCKPRLPSLGIGIVAKMQHNRALILDVDDRELTFVRARSPVEIGDLERLRGNSALSSPFGGPWTQYCESLVPLADEVIVSNRTLGELYGGTIVPHARDERLFDPARYDREAVRTRFGFEQDERIVLFAGTPRAHKGLPEVADAVRTLGDRRTRFCVLATREYGEVRDRLHGLEEWIRVLPYQPFEALPALIRASDLVCVLQDPSSDVAQYQIPAKVTDALAMEVPCLVRRVPPLEDLLGEGCLEEIGEESLATRIAGILDDDGSARRRAQHGREVFLARSSYAAVRPILEGIVESRIDAAAPVPAQFGDLVHFWHSAFPDRTPQETPTGNGSARIPAAPRRTAEDPYDVVMFWKQNDTGIYGRRHDMLMQQISASKRVRQVVQFDAPISGQGFWAPDPEGIPTHAPMLREQARLRERGIVKGSKLSHYTFVSPGAEDVERYLAYVGDVLRSHGFGERPTVLWVYPKSFEFPRIATTIPHDLIVADIVDDHRTWTREGSEHRDRIERNYREIARGAGVVLANCEQMQHVASEWTPRVHLVPNGVEYPVAVADRGMPSELSALVGPIVGYVGNLSSRIDVDLLARVAQSRPDWNLVFVGSAHAGRDILRLTKFGNVHFLGPRTYEVAKTFVRHFDVGIVPHLDNDMTRAMNPLKAYLYCSLGVPVVSTDIANLGGLRQFITVTSGADEFVAALDDAIDPGRRGIPGNLDAFLRDSSWERRAEHILELVDVALRERVPSRA